MDHLTNLLLAARDGDHPALERFIAESQRDVWRLCRYLGDPDTADDLAQETFERAIGSLHRYRAEGPARHWILTIARRVCVDSTRRRSRHRRLHRRIADQPAAPNVTSETAELDDLLARLDRDRRAAFVTTQVLGLRYEEAAELLGCPIGTIRSRVARARADLVALLDEQGPAEADRSRPTGRASASEPTGDGVWARRPQGKLG
ncbi:MAG: sigma-70 family RNA polymerase sigma factor [Ilumatobacteraceae bacterium]